MTTKHDSGPGLAHRLYCELGLCNGDPRCFLALTADQRAKWEDAVRAVCPASDWQPIETAPKTGRDVILWGPCRPDGATRPYARDANVGWWCADHWRTRTNEVCNATHWMPLPAAPQ